MKENATYPTLFPKPIFSGSSKFLISCSMMTPVPEIDEHNKLYDEIIYFGSMFITWELNEV